MQLSLGVHGFLVSVWPHFKHVKEIPPQQYPYKYKLGEVLQTGSLVRNMP